MLNTRRTYRAFTRQPVPGDVLSDILEAARTANCGANLLKLHPCIFVKDGEMGVGKNTGAK